MAEIVTCDFCKAAGKRMRRYPCPKDWFFMEAKDDTNPENVLIVWACSKECALALFSKGPGPRLDLGSA